MFNSTYIVSCNIMIIKKRLFSVQMLNVNKCGVFQSH